MQPGLFFIYYKCAKDPSPSNVPKEGSRKPEKSVFSLLQENNMLHCKSLKTGATKHFCNVSMLVYTNLVTVV